MNADQRLLVIVAHPDDETFGTGSVIAMAAASGVAVTVCCATRGEAGEAPPGFTGDLGALRESELRAAGQVLGVQKFVLLDYLDSGMSGEPASGTLAAADPDDVAARLDRVLIETAPDTIVTLDPDHGDGHRDHVVIAQATLQAARTHPGVRVYAWALPRRLLARWFTELEALRPDSEHLDLDRAGLGRPDDHITTMIDASSAVDVRERAIALHASQSSPYDDMPTGLRRDFLETDRLIRLIPPWTGGPTETRLFTEMPADIGRALPA